MTRSRKRTWGTGTCPNCEVRFPLRRKNQKFCSSACRIDYHNNRISEGLRLLHGREEEAKR